MDHECYSDYLSNAYSQIQLSYFHYSASGECRTQMPDFVCVLKQFQLLTWSKSANSIIPPKLIHLHNTDTHKNRKCVCSCCECCIRVRTLPELRVHERHSMCSISRVYDTLHSCAICPISLQVAVSLTLVPSVHNVRVLRPSEKAHHHRRTTVGFAEGCALSRLQDS